MDKKYIILIGLVAALVILLVVYLVMGRQGPQTTVLNLVTYNEDEKNLKDLIANFETQNSVKINFIKKDPKNYELDSLNLISTGKIDIWGIPHNWLTKHQDKLAPYSLSSTQTSLTGAYQTLYPPIVVTENMRDNKIYGIPLTLDPLVMFANASLRSRSMTDQNLTAEEQDLLYKNPANWDELAAQTPLLTQKTGAKITQAAVAMGTADLTQAPDLLTLLMLQNGSQMVSADQTQATFHTAINKFGGPAYPASRALNFYTSFSQPNSPSYTFSNTFTDPLRAFANGQMVYYLDYLSSEAKIKLINADLSYTIVPVPQAKETQNPVNLVSYETFTVPKTSKNQRMAWQFLSYLANDQVAPQYYQTSQKTPALTSQLQNSEKNIVEAINMAVSWPNPDVNLTAQIFRQAISDVLAGQSAQTALDSAAQAVTNLLKNLKG